MNRKLLIIVSICAGIALVFFVARRNKDSQTSQGPESRVTVNATFYPLAFFAEQVGKDFVNVRVIVTPGTEPHDFEPTARDIVSIQASDVFIYNGSGFDRWAEKIEPELKKKGVETIAAAAHVELLEASGKEHADEEEGEKERIDSPTDPHIWLDPVRVQDIARAIEQTLIKTDPEHAGEYHENATRFIGTLHALDNKYQEGLTSCTRRDIVTSHAAFAYPAARYRLNMIPISLSPTEEPSSRHMAEVVKLVKEKGATHIFFETLASPRLAETIAAETGAQTSVLNPIEGLAEEDAGRGSNYLTLMEDNLKALRAALECK